MRKSLQGLEHVIDHNKTYPSLPEYLEPLYVYLFDCGHSIMVISETLLVNTKYSSSELWKLEAAVPVKYVLSHPYKLSQGHLIIDVPYNDTFGIDVEDSYYEY